MEHQVPQSRGFSNSQNRFREVILTQQSSANKNCNSRSFLSIMSDASPRSRRHQGIKVAQPLAPEPSRELKPAETENSEEEDGGDAGAELDERISKIEESH